MKMRRIAAAVADPAEYLAGANRAFGAWGDEATFAWAFRGRAELLFIDGHDGRAIAGSGITYRTLTGGRPAAILTGSWTLPESRGSGAFTRIIEAACEIANEQDAVVLGFGRMDNASGRRLAAARAVMHPTFYCRSIPTTDQACEFEPLDADPSSFPSSFVYTPAEWRAQFLERPRAHIECIGRPGRWSAVVERVSAFDRIHAVSDLAALPALAARAHAGGRRLFWFATERPALECEWTDGFLSSMPAPPVSAWSLQNGDRM
jgi:hypothetical protein